MTIKTYQVGGHVRDQLLGIKSKDIDYAVEADSWQEMYDWVHETHDKVFLVSPQFLTIRALKEREPRDYVLCRKDGVYSDGRRPDSVEPGTIYDDLARRDFTVNAIAITEDGKFIDPHGGVKDLHNRHLRCVGYPLDRFSEDALRLIRAIRFSITKGLTLDSSIRTLLHIYSEKIYSSLKSVSADRIRAELDKCFRADTHQTMQLLLMLEKRYLDLILKDVWFKPTMEKR